MAEENGRHVDWHLPEDHIAYSASTLPEGVDMMALMRALDAKNRAARAARGGDRLPLLPKPDAIEIGG